MIRTQKKSDSGEMTATDESAAIDISTDDVTTMTTTNDAGTVITETDMNEIIPQSMTGDGTACVKGTGISNEIRSEDFSAEKSIGRQLEITLQGRHRKTGKRKKTAR